MFDKILEANSHRIVFIHDGKIYILITRRFERSGLIGAFILCDSTGQEIDQSNRLSGFGGRHVPQWLEETLRIPRRLQTSISKAIRQSGLIMSTPNEPVDQTQPVTIPPYAILHQKLGNEERWMVAIPKESVDTTVLKCGWVLYGSTLWPECVQYHTVNQTEALRLAKALSMEIIEQEKIEYIFN